MPHHEIKICPCCHKEFECKIGNIAHCHCSNIYLPQELLEWIKEKYNDCLCNECLVKYKNEYTLRRQ